MQKFDENQLQSVADYLKKGGVLAYPSESVWGIGCDGFCEEAIMKVLTLKSRPMSKGLIVLTDSIDKVKRLIHDLPEDIQNNLITTIVEHEQKANKQATTWLIPIGSSAMLTMPKQLMADFDSLALRVTPHPVLQRLCQLLTDEKNPYGFLVSTSCNPSGQTPATSLNMAQRYFKEQVAYLQGDGLGFDKPSQIIDVLTRQIIR